MRCEGGVAPGFSRSPRTGALAESGLIPAIVPPPRKTFLTKRSPQLTVDEFEVCIENREGTYPGH